MKTTTAVGAASAALLAVVAATTAVMWPGEPVPPPAAGPTAPPALLDDLPIGPATNVPWWQAGILHVGQTTIETPFRIVLFANGTTLIGRARFDRGSVWFVVRGSSLEPLVTSPGLVNPEISDDGRTIVWAAPIAEDRRRITAYDVASGTVTGEIEVPAQATCCDQGGELVVHGVTNDGRVIWSTGPSAVHAWSAGGKDAVRIDLHERQVASDNWPGGLMWQGGSRSIFRTPGVLATVSETGTVRRVGKVPTDQLGQWSPDGSAYAYPGHAERADQPTGIIWVQGVGSGEHRLMELPSELPWSLVAWESAHAVILETRLPFNGVDDQHAGLQALARCDTGTGACERVAGTPTGVPVLPYY